MLGVIFKYFFIIFCSIYIFSKIQNLNIILRNLIFSLIFSSVFSVVAYCTRENFSFLTLAVIIFVLTVYLFLLYRQPIGKTVTFTLISFGLNYIIYIFATCIIAPVCYLLLSDSSILTTVTYLLTGIIQSLFCFLLFKIKRLKNGIQNYGSKITGDIGVFISVSILLTASLFDKQNTNIMKSIILFCVILIGLLLFLWIKRYITNIYLEKVYKRNVEILENSLADQQEINRKLKHSNEELSMIIHRDNKLIPAMESAVEEILACNAPNEQKEKSKALLSQLKAMSSKRSTILTDYENLHKSLVQTGIFSIDASLKYLFSRANKDGISFDLSVTCDMRKAVNGLISENDLNTLILDLGENALIAVREAKKKNVLVVFGTENESFIISVYDSGIPFEKKVIDNLGKRRITTHKKTGGSGIGLMTAARLLRKHNASFVIDENVDSDSYSKRVSVIFDGLNQCRIITSTNKFTRPM